MATTTTAPKNASSLMDFLSALWKSSVLVAIVIPLLILIFQSILFLVGLNGDGLYAIWWALLGTPIVYFGLPWLVVTAFATLISSGPGGRKPLDTILQFSKTLWHMALYMTLVNTFAMFLMGLVFSRLSHNPMLLTVALAAAIGIVVWSLVYRAPATWFKKFSIGLFVLVLVSITIEFINPGAIRSVINYTYVSPIVTRYNNETAEKNLNNAETVRENIATRGKKYCSNKRDPNTWEIVTTVKERECSITQKELDTWNDGSQDLSNKLATTVNSVGSVFSLSPSWKTIKSFSSVGNNRIYLGQTGDRKKYRFSVSGYRWFMSEVDGSEWYKITSAGKIQSILANGRFFNPSQPTWNIAASDQPVDCAQPFPGKNYGAAVLYIGNSKYFLGQESLEVEPREIGVEMYIGSNVFSCSRYTTPHHDFKSNYHVAVEVLTVP